MRAPWSLCPDARCRLMPLPYGAETNTGSPGLPPGTPTLEKVPHSCGPSPLLDALNVRVTSVPAGTKSVESLPSPAAMTGSG